MSFVGIDRHALVERLEEVFDQSARCREPHLMALEAPQGWGKTRIVQVFYERIAARQPEPPYWPAALVPTGATGWLQTRKLVVPAEFGRGAEMPWMWWGLKCGQRQTRGLEHVLAEDVGQLEVHLEGLLAKQADRDRLKRDAGAVVGSGVDLAMDVLQVDTATAAVELTVNLGRVGVDAVRLARGQREADEVRATQASDPGRAPLVEKVVELVRSTAGGGLPFIIVVDDAHDADASVIAMLERIFAGPMPVPVLCILTAWPETLAMQEQREEGLGWWLKHAVKRDPEHCDRRPLARLQLRDLAAVVRERAPGTDASVAGALADRADGNPLVLEGLLRGPRVVRATRDGKITLATQEVHEFPNTIPTIMRAAWDELPSAVREALCLCSLQGREAVERLVLHSYDAIAQESAPQAKRAIGEAIDPHAWIRRQKELVRFHERYTFEIAQDNLVHYLSRDAVSSGRRSIAAQIAGWLRDRDSWRPLHEDSKLALRGIHVDIARGGHAEDKLAAAASARELGTVALDSGQYGQARALAEDALLWAEGEGDPRDELHLGLRLVQARAHLALEEPAHGRELLGVLISEIEAALPADHPLLLESQTVLARALLEAGDWRRARTMLEKLTKDSEGATDDNTLDARFHLALAILQAGDPDEAKRRLQALLPVRERAFTADHPDAVEVRLVLANLAMLDEPTRAREIREEAVRFAEQALGPDHPHVLDARSSLALTLRDLGYYREARALQEQTAADCERLHGKRHQKTLAERVHLARTLVLAGDPRGTSNQRAALAGLEQALGANHRDTLAARREMAETLAAQGDVRIARLTLERLLADLEGSLGERHPDTGATRRALAGVLLSERDQRPEDAFRLALQLLEQEFHQRERALGLTHPSTVEASGDLAMARYMTGGEGAARKLQADVVQELEQRFGRDARETLAARQLAGDVLLQVGRHEEALSTYGEVREARRQALGDEHAETIEAALRVARALEPVAALDANVLYEDVYLAAEETHGPNHPVTSAALSSVAHLARALGDHERAGKAFQRLAAIHDEVLGADHLETLRTHYWLGASTLELGEGQKAKRIMEAVASSFRRVHQDAERELGAEHPYTTSVQAELAHILDALGRTDEARAIAPLVGGTLSAPLPRRSYSEETLTLRSPDRLSEVSAKTSFRPPGSTRGRFHRLRVIGWNIAIVGSGWCVGAGLALSAPSTLAALVLFAPAMLVWWLAASYILPVLFALNVTAARHARARGSELEQTAAGYVELEVERFPHPDGSAAVRRRFQTKDPGGPEMAWTETYSVRGWTVLTIATAVAARFVEDRAPQLEGAVDHISIARASRILRLKRELQRKVGRGRVRGAIRTPVPLGWLSRESLQVGQVDRSSNVICSVEPVDAALETREYAELQGQYYPTDEFPGYQEHSFDAAEVFSGRSGYLRAFSWHPEDGPPVHQWQAYLVKDGRGYMATATCRQPDEAKVRTRLLGRIKQIEIKEPPAAEGTAFARPAEFPK